MARNQSALISWSQYLALRCAVGLIQCFDVEQNLNTAAHIGALYSRFNPRRRKRAERNIALSFPDWPAERVARTAERSLQHMFQLFMVDAMATPRLVTPDTWPEYVHLGDVGAVLDHLVRGEPMILLTAHCGNWELLGYAMSVIGYPVSALARPLDNPLINRWLLSIREARGMQIITKWGGTDILQNILRDGGRVGFTADQNAGEQGLFVPFFGRLASSYKSIGLLAMRYEIPIAAAHARRIGDGMRYEINCTDLIRPEDWADQDDPLFYITARFNRAMEMMILAAPDQYLWLHRRWKSRPRYERKGLPMPVRLRDKIAALPWMTKTELDRIVSLSNDPNHQELS